MKTLFAKYNRERLPYFQTVTKIVQDDNGKTYAVKEPLSAKASNHIKAIYSNYHLLNSKFDIKLSTPILSGNRIQFEMAKGESLESLLLKALYKNNESEVLKIINIYVDYLDRFVSNRDVVFKPCEKFREIFGKWDSDGTEDIIDIANVDLILSNLFLYNDELTQIDYEWVFDFPIPESYVLWRTFHLFLNYHHMALKNTQFNEILERAIPDFIIDKFIINDRNFYKYVCGKKNSYFLNTEILKPVAKYNQSYNKTIDLFYDNGNGFNSQNLITIGVDDKIEYQEFEFDLVSIKNIRSLRLDPLNNYVVLKINKLSLITSKGEVDLVPKIYTNGAFCYEGTYWFFYEDPQIYFYDLEGLESCEIYKIIVSLQYIYTGIDAIQVLLNQTQSEFNRIIKSRTWRWGNKIANILRGIVPSGSVRRKIVRKTLFMKKTFEE